MDLVLQKLSEPFYSKFDFWISIAIGLGGVLFSVMAFMEARRAKHAATEAGKTVKIQTITIDLTEISQRLDRLKPDIRFSEARDLLAEITRRLRRVVSPFQKDPEVGEPIKVLLSVLTSTKTSLNAVRPADPSKESETPYAVYNAIEADFAAINNSVADLLGLFEKKTIDFGDENA
jgi:hypothetical protein